MKKALHILKRIASLCLAIVIFAGVFFSGTGLVTAEASALDKLGLGLPKPTLRSLSMKTARALAIEESSAYFAVETKIETKKANLESSRKKIKLKQKSMSQFRWSPLLSFKFPQKPNEAQAYEFQFKPVSIQEEIDKATHELIDTALGIYEEINNLYVNIVFLQRKIAFEEQRIAAYEDGLERNKARLLTGDATQADIDAISKKLEASKKSVSTDKRTLTADLEKLSKKINMDVTTETRFETPFIEASIPREVLDAFIEYTLDRDQQYYEVCLDETTARISVNTNESLVQRQFGGESNTVANYVNMAMGGIEMKGSIQRAFKTDYKAFLDMIDSHWQGKKKILFIKIPRLWFKGSLAGTRYVDDDPNVLYEDVLAYSAARVEKEKVGDELIQKVKDTFESYISIRNSYLTAIEDLDKAEKDLEANRIRNQLGLVSFEEYDSMLSDYEELQNSFLDMVKTYSETLYSFDRLTCGAVSAYFSGTDPNLSVGQIGTSHVEKEIGEGARYFIKQIVQSEAFELNIYVPDYMGIDVTDFELWCDGVQVGERTPADEFLKHVALSKTIIEECMIRLYDGDEVIDDVKIDPATFEGPLPITKDRNIVKTSPDEIGSYDTETNDAMGIITITVNITEDPEAKFYRVETADGAIMSGEALVKNKESFKHLAIVENGLEDVIIRVYDEEETELYSARFVTDTRKIKKSYEN